MMLEIIVSIIFDLKVFSVSIVHKIIKELFVKKSFPINEFIPILCFKDVTQTLLSVIEVLLTF